MKIISAGKTEKGLREQNQDYWRKLSLEDITILVTADGNGGAGGKQLAKIAVETSISYLCLALCQGFTEERLKELGLSAIGESTKQVAKAKELNEWPEAGTTMTLVMLSQKFLYLFWVGDSLCYLFDGSLKLLSNPHNLAEMLIEKGQTRESVEAQPSLKSVLTRCLGHDSCEPDVKVIELSPPYYCVMLGSDGVFNSVAERSLEEMAKARLIDFDAEKLCDDVIQTALSNGSDDNCTLVVALALPEVSKTERRMTKLYEWRE